MFPSTGTNPEVMQVYNNDRTSSILGWASKWGSFECLLNNELTMFSPSASCIDDDDVKVAVVASDDFVVIATNIWIFMLT